VFVAVCVKDFDTTFERAKRLEAAAAKTPVTCPPNDGCAPAYHVVVVECGIDDDLTQVGFYNGSVQPQARTAVVPEYAAHGQATRAGARDPGSRSLTRRAST
jgi:hypothetical protein